MLRTIPAALTVGLVLHATAARGAAPSVHGGQPVVSPHGDRIAFLSDRSGATDIFVINVDGTGETQLTRTPEAETGLQWSRDGKRIVYSILAGDESRLVEIRPDGTDEKELGRFPGRTPTLSPNGKRLVYMAGTWTATRLTTSALDGSRRREITDGSSIAWNNHWSPDGKRLAFTGRDEPKGELAVFVMKADGTGRRKVTHLSSDEGGAQWPVWSPGGMRLAVQVNMRVMEGTAHIFIVDVATGDARKLAAHDAPYLDETPSWFPDGKRLAFQSNRTGTMEVWAMDADGTNARQITGSGPRFGQTSKVERHTEPKR